ncbi:hypothetical protein ACFV1N_46090 [Streptosporangium canum]|uniref:hypothetical protein n=1 Tax=Streptosporangium canum TaxID=324952 RepID=UPI00368EBBDA
MTTTLRQRFRRPAVIVLSLAVLLAVAARCPAEPTACAVTAMVAVANPPEPVENAEVPPEPIEDGSYRDGSNEAPPEPITDGSYRDGSYEEGEQGDKPKKKTGKKVKPGDDQDDASSC